MPRARNIIKQWGKRKRRTKTLNIYINFPLTTEEREEMNEEFTRRFAEFDEAELHDVEVKYENEITADTGSAFARNMSFGETSVEDYEISEITLANEEQFNKQLKDLEEALWEETDDQPMATTDDETNLQNSDIYMSPIYDENTFWLEDNDAWTSINQDWFC